MKPKISIVFPTHNGKFDTLKCLKSLSSLSYPSPQMEIIMVDNASSDSSIETVKKKFPRVKIIPLEKNIGFAAAINKGITVSGGDYIFIINNDMIFDKEFLTVLVESMERDSKLGIAGGKIYYQVPKDKILFCGVKFNPWLGSIHRLSNPDQTKESEWIQGCAMLIKKTVVEKVGLFDEKFFFSFEDQDFCQRAKKAGFKIIYHPKAVAWHKEGATIDREGLQKKATELYKAKFYYLFKNCSLLQIITATLFQFLLIAPVRRLLFKNPPFFVRPMLTGFFYNLKHLPQIVRSRL